MKIKQEHYNHIESAINLVLSNHPAIVESYRNGDFMNADKVVDKQKRFCFDLLYMADLSRYVCDNLYSYMDDSHIYTALRKIAPKL